MTTDPDEDLAEGEVCADDIPPLGTTRLVATGSGSAVRYDSPDEAHWTPDDDEETR